MLDRIVKWINPNGESWKTLNFVLKFLIFRFKNSLFTVKFLFFTFLPVEQDENEDEFIHKHLQAKLLTTAMAYKYAENKGDIRKAIDSFELFSNNIALSIYNSVKTKISVFGSQLKEE